MNISFFFFFSRIEDDIAKLHLTTRVTEFIRFSVHFAFGVEFSLDGNPTINALAHLEFETILYTGNARMFLFFFSFIKQRC